MKINEVTKRTIVEAISKNDFLSQMRQRLGGGDTYDYMVNWMNDDYNGDHNAFIQAAAAERDNFWQMPTARRIRDKIFAVNSGAGRNDNTPTGEQPVVPLNTVTPTPSGASQAAQAAQDAGTMDPEQAVFTAPELTQPRVPNAAPAQPAAPTSDTAPTLPRGAAGATPTTSSPATPAPTAADAAPAAQASPEPVSQPTRPGQERSGANFGAITQNLRTGSRGEGVRALQQRLGINADGIFGPATDRAVKQFQQQNNLQVDGIVGTQTLAALQGNTSALGRITAAPATSQRPQARPTTQNASKENMGNKLNEANMNISVNGDSAAEVAELLRIMQLAGAPGAKEVDIDDITSKPMPSISSPSMGPQELDMGDMIRMISHEEEDVDGGFGDATTEPDEYTSSNAGDVSDMIPSGDDLHKSKKSYPATAGGDNPMNVENSIKATLLKALAEKKKPDANKNGIPDYAEDGKGTNDLAKGKKPKKGKVPPQFVKEGDIESNFENKNKDINNLGRKMMDMSSKMSGTDDTSLMMANALSRLGEVLAEFGGSGFAANNMNDVIKKSALNKEIVQMLMKKAKAS